MKQCRFFQFCVFSPPVCLCFLTGPWLAACMADELRNPPCVIGSGSGRWGNWPDTPTSAIHSTFLLHPCPNPTTLPPLPSASPPSSSSTAARPEIFHYSRPAPWKVDQVQEWQMPVLGWLYCFAASRFSIVLACPVSSAVHVRFPRAGGSLPGGGGALDWGKVWEVCGTQGQQRGMEIE